MKNFVCTILTAAMVSALLTLPVQAADTKKATETVSYSYSYGDAKTYTREMEKLDRGLIAVSTDDGVYLSWRLFDSEDAIFGSADSNVSFNVYRGKEKIATVTDKTNYTDAKAGTSYSVAPVIDGVEGAKCEAVSVMSNSYFDIPLTKPADETITYVYPYTDDNGNTSTEATYSFFPADCSTGDLDGDGEYEIIVKWTSSERDVGSPGTPEYSGTVHLAAYKLDGTKMWQNDIELGKNVYSSAHTVQFLVYDFDMDGKAEMMCQTSLGSKDATGAYVSHAAQTEDTIKAFTDEQNASADYRGGGRITTGEEFLTVFNGETGSAMDTISLPTSRGSANGVDYGDDFGNRSNRFIADVAYLDGIKPYAVYLRGYYFGRNGKQRTSIAGISWDGEKLSPDYRFDTKNGEPGYYEGAYQYVGNGNHNCTVADVDNDGKDEFITGALCMEVDDNNDFKPRWCTYLQHGDALHIGDYDPTHDGLEFFTVHEDDGTNTLSGTNITMDFGMSVIDACTGEIMFHVPNTKDTGRGAMANTGSGGYYQITGVGSYQCNGGTNFTSTRNGAGSNFRIFWDGDLYDNLLDGTSVTDWNGRSMSEIFNASNYGCVKINGTKSNPALQADLFGDWREELIYPTTDGKALRVFTTTTPTDYKIKTLMHDPVYRSGVAAEQTAYNQPPHVGIYMGEEMFETGISRIAITSPDKTVYYQGGILDTTGLTVTAYYADGTSKEITNYTLQGYDPNTLGKQTVTVSYAGKTATFTVTVNPATISAINNIYKTSSTSSVASDIPIGSYSDSFTIEHTFKIDSMPANGNDNKSTTNGFFFRFNPNDGTGAGWYLTANGTAKANVIWKSGSSRNNATNIATGINIGETYTFKYEFTHVGDGTGAAVTMTVIDSSGNIAGSVSGLNLRNMTNDNQKVSPLGNIQIYNQANSNSTASVTIDNAKLYGSGEIIDVNGADITVNISSPSLTKLYAAKYDSDGVLENIEILNTQSTGENTVTASFVPDKLFLWSDSLSPIDFWSNPNNSNITTTVTDEAN